MIASTQLEELPLVTIGMPVRNGAPYIQQALSSLLAQDYPNLEIIISDNVSTDSTPFILAEAMTKDPRIQVFRQPDVLTAFNNFEWVLSRGRGRYFMWAAHDDLREANFVSSLVASLENTQDAVMAFCDVRVSSLFAGIYVDKHFDYETLGMDTLLRMRLTSLLQCYHIYGLWRAATLKNIPFIYNPWWPDLPLMIAASSLGGFCRVKGLYFDYLEVPKTSEQRAQYQDNTFPANRIVRILWLLQVTFRTVNAVSGIRLALFATFFVIEKQFKVFFRLLINYVRLRKH